MKRLTDFIHGAAWGLVKRLRFCVRRHASASKNSKIIKMTGIGNHEGKACFYLSEVHFIHNIPSYFRKDNYDYLVAQNFLHSEFLSCRKPKIFLTMEPTQTMTRETKGNIESGTLGPYLYLYGEPDIDKRMFYPGLADFRRGMVKQLERTLREKRSGLCCIINRYSEHPELNLLQERIRFVRAMGKDIDIYGAEPWGGIPNKWKAFPNYHGMAKDKQKTLKRYNFVLAFENSDFPGYITEKIFDAFKSGAVPLYWGGGGFLKETIPADCYIECRNQNPDEIYRLIRNMTQEDIVSFRRAAIEFLKSDAADRFTVRYLRGEVVRRLEGMERNGFAAGTH
jgi:hypothetical protein